MKKIILSVVRERKKSQEEGEKRWDSTDGVEGKKNIRKAIDKRQDQIQREVRKADSLMKGTHTQLVVGRWWGKNNNQK